MKTISSFLLFFCCLYFSLSAQNNFQVSLPTLFDTTMLRCTPDGKAIYLIGKIEKTSQVRFYFLKLNNSGSILWHKEYISADKLEIKSFHVFEDGFLILLDGSKASYLSKIKGNNGSVEWSKFAGDKSLIQLFDFATDGKNRIWLSALHLKQNAADSNYYFQTILDNKTQAIQSKQNIFEYSNPFAKGVEMYRASNMTFIPSTGEMTMVEDFDVPFRRTSVTWSDRHRLALAFANEKMDYREEFLDDNIIHLVATQSHIAFCALKKSTLVPEARYSFGILNKYGKYYRQVRFSKYYVHPIHNYDGSIVFYSPRDRTLSKLDTSFNPIWVKKYDNCLSSYAFAADIAKDGTIFTVRNTDGKTVVSKINPDGKQPICVDYNSKFTENVDLFKEFITELTSSTVDFYGYPKCGFPSLQDSIFKMFDESLTTLPFCLKFEANFDTKDTVCQKNNLIVTTVDTNSLLRHTWYVKPFYDEKMLPTSIVFDSLKWQKIFHQVEIKGCKDTASRYVYVIPRPKIPIQDTVVCGFKDLAVDLFDKNGIAYFLDNAKVNSTLTITKSGIYDLKIKTRGCDVVKKIKVKIVDFELPKIEQDSALCQGEIFKATFDNRFENIFWDNQKIANDTFSIQDAAKHNYKITYKLDKDCVITGDFQVKRSDCKDFFAPTIFSPNEDNINDIFQIFPRANIQILSLEIFDRWGNLLQKQDNYPFTWDGFYKNLLCDQGVYTFKVQYFDWKEKKQKRTGGDVLLIW
jgi:gliding motility-associated-like protein